MPLYYKRQKQGQYKLCGRLCHSTCDVLSGMQANAAVLGGHARVMPLTWGKQADAHNVLSSLHASTNSGSSTSSTPSSSTPAADASAMHTCSNGSDVIPATVYAQQQAIAAAAVTADLNSPAHLPDNAINGASTDASIPLQPPASCSSPPAADFIIASDVTYEAVQFKALVQSLVDLSGPYTQVLLGFEERPGARDFVQLCVKHGFSVQKVSREVNPLLPMCV